MQSSKLLQHLYMLRPCHFCQGLRLYENSRDLLRVFSQRFHCGSYQRHVAARQTLRASSGRLTLYNNVTSVVNGYSLYPFSTSITTSTEPDDRGEINDILSQASEELSRTLGQTALSFSHLEDVVRTLHAANIKGSDIVACLKESYAEMQSFNSRAIEQGVEFLRELGFHPSHLVQLLGKYPGVINLNRLAASKAVSAFRSIGVPDGRVQEVFSENPSLFTISPAQVSRRMEELGTVFTRREILTIAASFPQAYLDSWDDIKAKMSYVTDVMKLQPKYLLNCHIFSHSLFHMKVRHSLLVKEGLYTPPIKKDLTENENSNIGRIMDTPDKVFAIQVARLSVEEYEAYRHMMALDELEPDGDDSDDDDDDDDDDDS